MKKEYIKFINNRIKISNIIKSINIDFISKHSFIEMKYILKHYKFRSIHESLNNVLVYYNIEIPYKIFVKLFLIYFYENKVLPKTEIYNIKPSNLRIKLLNSCINLVNYMYKFNFYDEFCILRLSNRIKAYLTSYKKWYDIDRINLLKVLSLTYHYNNKQISKLKVKNEDYMYFNELLNLEVINKEQNSIKEVIYNLEGEIVNEDKLIDIDKILVNKKDYIDEYKWKLLKKDLSRSPFRGDLIILYLLEIKLMLIRLFPYEIDTFSELNSLINLKNFNKNKVDTHYILLILNKLYEILEKIILLNKNEIKERHKNLLKKLINGDELHTFVPNSLKFIYDKLLGLIDEKFYIKK